MAEFDPYAYEVHEDPYPFYRALRDEAPLYRNEAIGFVALSRHADVLAAFKDTETFSNRHGVSLDADAFHERADTTMSFLAMDPPRHTRMRALVSRGFTPRRVAELEVRVREIARGHLDACAFTTTFMGKTGKLDSSPVGRRRVGVHATACVGRRSRVVVASARR